jgi:hypothetical protein
MADCYGHNNRRYGVQLEPLAAFRVTLGDIIDLGDTPAGHRRVVPITGGDFSGERLQGTVLAGGADWQLVHLDGMITVDTRYLLRTHDGVTINLATSGVRHGPPEVLQRLAAGASVDPAEYYFRLFLRFETGDARYAWLNRTLAVAEAARSADTVRYQAYTLT